MTYKNTLETERLILRPLTIDDFEAVHSWAGNPANTRYVAWGPNTEKQTRNFLESVESGKDYAVILKDSDKVIGSCGIYSDSANDTGELGWVLHKDYWKHGYGTELGKELIRYGFEDLKLRRMFAPCAAVNYGSYRVMERNGMHREALHIKKFWARVDKEWIDEAVYAILAEEYKNNQTAASYSIESPTGEHRIEADRIASETWGGRKIAVHGELYHLEDLMCVTAVSGKGEILGYCYYQIDQSGCEIMALESTRQNIGIGTSLIEAIRNIAIKNHSPRLYLQTSNDNTHALRFYQRHGFTMCIVRWNAFDYLRKIKPSIPPVGDNSIPLLHEIEFEMKLCETI